MNFKRVEWIFFIAFIMLDFFLVSSYFRQGPIMDAVANHPENTTVSVLKSMRDDQITVGTTSNKTGIGYYVASPNSDDLKSKAGQLRYQTWDTNGSLLNSTFATMIKAGKNPQKELKTVIDDPNQIIDGKDYQYSKSLSTKDTIVYSQVINGRPFDDANGQIRFRVKNGYVQGYTQGHLSKLQTLRGGRKILSQKRALIWLYQYNKLPSNSTIEDSHLAYSKMLTVNGNTIFIPTWVFAIKNNASETVIYRRINAFTGAVMDDSGN